MDFSQFHFENYMWLWGIGIIPAVLLLYALFFKGAVYTQVIERFADKNLLPHLLKIRHAANRTLWIPLLLWSLAWTCGMVSMAGPRWDYTEVRAFKPENDLVILLDLSTSMNTQDVKPSRIVRAREEIEDILNMNRGVTVGLVAYAAVPHMIVPLTDDMKTIRNLLPAIDPSLVTIQGARLKPAIEMAARMLDAEQGNNKSILVISDGNFEDNDITDLAHDGKGASIYTMGVGTAEGAPIPVDHGGWIKDQSGKMIISRLQADRLNALSAAGHGLYVEANYSDSDKRAILDRIDAIIAGKQDAHKTIRIWQERFYIPALVLALLLLPLFRKRYVFPVVVLIALLFSGTDALAATWTDLFRNQEQRGQKAFEQGDYKGAMEKFSTPYKHGVAAYKAGQYDQAAQSFKEVNDPRTRLQAEYNLGNAQLMLGKPEDAISSYESVLKQNPNNESARHNLEIAKKMLKQKQKAQQNKNNSSQKENGEQNKQPSQNEQSIKNQPQDNKNSSLPQKQGSGEKDKQQNKSGQNNHQDQKEVAQNQSQGNSQNSKNQPQPGRQQKNQQGQGAGDKEKQQNKTDQNSLQGQKGPSQNQPQNSDQNSQGQVQQKKEQQQPAKNNFASAHPGDMPEPATKQGRPRTQQDINADQWLNRIQDDPGSFLRNQFMIEDNASRKQ